MAISLAYLPLYSVSVDGMLEPFFGTLMSTCTGASSVCWSISKYTALNGKAATEWLLPFSKSVSISLVLTMRSCFLKVGADIC